MKAPYFKQILISFFLLFLVSLIAFASPALAEGDVVDIYFFHSKTCPHCVKQKPLMEDLDKHNEGVKLHAYEVNEHPQIWRDFLTTHQIKSAAVPRTLIG